MPTTPPADWQRADDLTWPFKRDTDPPKYDGIEEWPPAGNHLSPCDLDPTSWTRRRVRRGPFPKKPAVWPTPCTDLLCDPALMNVWDGFTKECDPLIWNGVDAIWG